MNPLYFKVLFPGFHIDSRSPFIDNLTSTNWLQPECILSFNVGTLCATWCRRQPVDIQLRHFLLFPGCTAIYIPMDTGLNNNGLVWKGYPHYLSIGKVIGNFVLLPCAVFVVNVLNVYMFLIFCSDSLYMFWLEKMYIGIVTLHFCVTL